MKKLLKITSLMLVSAAIFSSCKKNEKLNSESEIVSKGNSNLSIGDGKWDVLSFGYDATADFMDQNSLSDAPIIDLTRFATDYLSRIDVGSGTQAGGEHYAGSTALTYLNEIIKKKAYGLELTAGNKDGDKGKGYLSGTLNLNRTDDGKTTYSSKYSYATFESIQQIKRIRFTGDAPVSLLINYLTPEFTNNIATLSADALIKRYGTHVLLDITLGGTYRFDYSAAVVTQTEDIKKSRGIKAGLFGNLLKKVGININTDFSTEEINNSMNENRNQKSTLKFFGGTNSGQAISFDINGNSSESFNIGAWGQSLTDRNCRLVGIGNGVLLYHFIADPVKKNEVKAAIEKYVKDRELRELNEAPVYQYFNDKNQEYIYSLNNNVIDPSWSGWARQATAFYAFKSAENGASPVYEFRNSSLTRSIYTTNRNLIQPNWPGWSIGTLVFYAYKENNIPGTVPIYEFYNQKNECNLYSPDINAVNGYPGWTRLGIAFYAYDLPRDSTN